MNSEPKDINIGDLKNITKPEDEDVVTLKKLDPEEESNIAGDIYTEAEDFPGYFQEQFKSKLQRKIDATDNKLYLLQDQESFDLINIPLRNIDVEKDIMDDFTITIIGRRRSGKTFWADWLMYHLRHRFPAGIVITGTKLNNFWARRVPEEYIHDVKNLNEILPQVFERQKYLMEHPELGIDPRFFLILDDVLSDKYKIRFSKPLSQIFTDGRHHKLFIIVTTQDPRGIPPDLRENSDLAVVFRQFQATRKESICEDFISYIDQKSLRLKFLWEKTKKLTENGEEYQYQSDNAEGTKSQSDGIPQTLCVLQANLTEDVREIFKRSVAEKVPDYILGDVDYWKVMESGNWKSLLDTFKEFCAKSGRTSKF